MTSSFAALPRYGWEVIDIGPDTATDPDAALAFAASYGTPSARDGADVWPISARATSGTFSVTAEAAPLHTDAQYRPDPEEAFVLVCVRPAADGGDSVLLRVDDLLETLTTRRDWPRLHELMTDRVWSWRIPAVFDGPELSPPAAVIGRDPKGHATMRWRRDNLHIADNEILHAASTIATAAARHRATESVRLRAGQALVCDNRTVLHGRTPFADLDRLLWRIRVRR